MLDVSIIIVSYNSHEIIGPCLESIILNSVNFDYEIIVVDNCSSDGTKELIKSKFKKVIFIESENNCGFGSACNKGHQVANGEYLLFLNPDTELVNNAIRHFLDYFRENQKLIKIGAIGSFLLDLKLEKTHSFGKFPSIIEELKRFLPKIISGARKTAHQLSQTFEVDYITGANLFIRKELFNNLGGFDEEYFMYYEETDLQKRMNEAGYKRMIIEGPKIIHTQAKSLKKLGAFEKFIKQKA